MNKEIATKLACTTLTTIAGYAAYSLINYHATLLKFKLGVYKVKSGE